jgi:hypothetical protein
MASREDCSTKQLSIGRGFIKNGNGGVNNQAFLLLTPPLELVQGRQQGSLRNIQESHPSPSFHIVIFSVFKHVRLIRCEQGDCNAIGSLKKKKIGNGRGGSVVEGGFFSLLTALKGATTKH